MLLAACGSDGDSGNTEDADTTATGTCDFMVTIYDQSGQILSATPGTACESQLQLDFMGYDVEEFTVALESGGQTAVKKKAVEG